MLMQPFYLNCWVPSIKNYLKIQELKMSQFDILSKYIANNDNIHIANCLENIIEENLEDKNYFTELTKFDRVVYEIYANYINSINQKNFNKFFFKMRGSIIDASFIKEKLNFLDNYTVTSINNKSGKRMSITQK